MTDPRFDQAVRLDRMLRSLLKDYPERMFLKCGVSQIPLVVGMING
jgi:hypothetical protein